MVPGLSAFPSSTVHPIRVRNLGQLVFLSECNSIMVIYANRIPIWLRILGLAASLHLRLASQSRLHHLPRHWHFSISFDRNDIQVRSHPCVISFSRVRPTMLHCQCMDIGWSVCCKQVNSPLWLVFMPVPQPVSPIACDRFCHASGLLDNKRSPQQK